MFLRNLCLGAIEERDRVYILIIEKIMWPVGLKKERLVQGEVNLCPVHRDIW